MTKHDTWVKLKPGNPFEPVLDLFPFGMIPMRDPFPLERMTTADGEVVLWIMDLERLKSSQATAISQLIASACKGNSFEVASLAMAQGGFAMKYEWIDSMLCGPEGFQRQKELADFFETAPQPPSARAYREFYNSQHERWIEGHEVPPPINSIEDVDPRLRTPELEQHFKMSKVESVIAQGNYSVMDVLMGQPMVDALNQIDPENTYSLVSDEDFEDDKIYE